jgi:adenine phosphoribosyltransferase
MRAALRKINTHTGDRCDVIPLFSNIQALNHLVAGLAGPFRKRRIGGVVCIDSLGFILGAAVAMRLGKRIIPLRKEGKLPVPADRTRFCDYTGEHKGLEISRGAIRPGECILLVDEWSETGAQLAAAVRLIEKQGGTIAGIAVIHMDKNRRTDRLRKRFLVCVADEATRQS